jgi:polar amino acid transport system substrate-binding protein
MKINGWKSLLPYHVAYVNGWRNCERELKNARAITVVKNEALLFTLLEKDRAQVGIFGQSTGKAVLEKRGYSRITPLVPPIVISDLFLYLHKKHQNLIPDIVNTLRGMKKDGTYDRFIHQNF